MSSAEFEILTGINPSKYRVVEYTQHIGEKQTVQRSLKGWNADRMVSRQQVINEDTFEDGVLEMARPGRDALYFWYVSEDLLLMEMTRPGSVTKLTYVFEPSGESDEEVINHAFSVEVEDGVFKVIDETTINGQSASEVDPTYTATVLCNGSIKYNEELDAPLLKHPDSVQPGHTFTFDWSKEASKYFSESELTMPVLTLKSRIRNKWVYITKSMGDNGALIDLPSTPTHHKQGKRQFVRINHFNK